CLFLFVSLFNGLLLFAFFFCRYRHHYALHSFPTRRSSDLTFQNIRNICRNIRISVDQLDTCPPGFFAYLARNAHISRLASTAADLWVPSPAGPASPELCRRQTLWW